MRDEKGYSALHVAAERADLVLLRKLLSDPERCNLNQMNAWSETPLRLAVKMGHLEVVKILLQHGADPKVQSMWQKSLFQLAKELSFTDIAEYFINAVRGDSPVAPIGESNSVRGGRQY